MITFLTSSFVKYQSQSEYVPCPLDESNHFGDNLRRYWKPDTRLLIFVSDPCDEKLAAHLKTETLDAFSLADFSISEIRCFNNKYIEEYYTETGCSKEAAGREALKEALKWCDVFYLSGGHGPTENAFMNRCDLKTLIHDKEIFDGIFIGLSAGAVNAADSAYLIPELQGESIDPDYVRFSEGLGLTTLNIIPHFEYFRIFNLDGKPLINEIVYDDSFKRKMYIIHDGSYFMIRNGITEFFGDGITMENGIKHPLSPGIINADNLRLKDRFTNYFDATVSEYYDWVFELDYETGKIDFLHISNVFVENGIIPVNIDSFDELNKIFSTKLVVNEEKEAYIHEINIDTILKELDNKGRFVRTVHINILNGVKAENLRITPIINSKKRILVSLIDITMVLDHDWMTDEYSRSGFLSQAEALLKQPEFQQGYSILYSNIRSFKAINDILGTRSGDMVIFLERDILVKHFSPVLIARLESDHFALITKTENITDENMNAISSLHYTEGSKHLPIFIRCGVYNITNTKKKITHMLDQAKLAEESISSDFGKSYAVCNEKLIDEYMNSNILISEIDKALKNSEFMPYYQPIVDAKTEKIVSAEALIRWYSPTKFIPVLEKTGLTTKIDSFMIDKVLSFNMERLQKGQNVVPCAVNLSRMDFYDTKLMEMLKEKLSKLDNIHKFLKLEITESAYTFLESDALDFLKEMKKLQLSLLLDDFGCGMSSLSTLENCDFDTIKLDMSFVKKIGKSSKSEAIIRHTIGMAHETGSIVVAEGVEYKEQLDFLRSVGCDMIQGYYFYKPMPEDEFAKLL